MSVLGTKGLNILNILRREMYSKFSPLWRGGKTATTAIHFYCAGSVAANYRLAPFKPMSHQFGYYSTCTISILFQLAEGNIKTKFNCKPCLRGFAYNLQLFKCYQCSTQCVGAFLAVCTVKYLLCRKCLGTGSALNRAHPAHVRQTEGTARGRGRGGGNRGGQHHFT